MSNLSELQRLCNAISSKYGLKVKNYGEGHEIIVQDQGANYVSISDETPCSVDDNYDLVLFFVRESSQPDDGQLGKGLRRYMQRIVNFKLVANAKKPHFEHDLTVLLNSLPPIEYVGSDNTAKQIAQTYFGLVEHDFRSYFFTIDFTAREQILCDDC